MKKPKLLYLLTEDWFFCSHFFDRAKAARDAGFEVVVVARENAHGQCIRSENVKLIPFSISRRGLNPFRELITVFRLATLYRQERPSLVHHIALKPILYGTLAALFSKCRCIVNAPVGLGFVYTSQSWMAGALRLATRLGFKILLNPSGSKVIFENPDDLDACVATKLVRPEDAVLIRGAGVCVDTIRPCPEPSGPVVVLLAARMLWDKGIGEYVQAAQLLKARGYGVRMLLAGEPDKENPASIPHAILAAWNAEGFVEWLGFSDNMSELLSLVHIVCLPSYYREGLPKFLLEGLAAGKPVVTTDTPGCRETVPHGENGFLVPPYDASALAEALEKLIQNPALRQSMGIISRELAVREFATERVIAETLEVYTQILERKK